MQADHHNMKTWSVDDFERYHSGKMPGAEMHALEKAALEDPFLQDALDGYSHTKTPVADISELRQKILSQTVNKAPVLWYRKKVFINAARIAAILIVFAGFAWLMNKNKETAGGNDSPLARLEEKKAAPAAETSGNLTQPQPKKSEAVEEKIDLPEPQHQEGQVSSGKEQVLPSQQQVSAAEKETVPVPAERKSDDHAVASNAAPVFADEVRTETVLRGKAAGEKVNELRSYKGNVTNSEGEPVVGAAVVSKDKKYATQTDEEGRFRLDATDSSLQLMVSAVGYNSKQQEIKPSAAPATVVLNDRDAALSEVVVTSAAGIKRNARQTTASVSSGETAKTLELKMPSNVSTQNVYLVSGQTEFSRFAKDSLSAAPARGNVELSFDIDDKGNPVRIKVARQLCPDCDNLAVKLVQQATWKKIKKRHKAIVNIGFQ